MQYLLLFLEGIITFISPCLLPMLPVYVSFFAAGQSDKRRALVNSLGFAIGFSFVFVLLGAFAASLGMILIEYAAVINIITGCIVIFLGLNLTGLIRVAFLNPVAKKAFNMKKLNFVSSILFGITFSISWTPCAGALLGHALVVASRQESVFTGALMLLTYSLGLGLPFIISAVILDKLKSTFGFIKSHYQAINLASGILLIIAGIFMATGLLGRFLSLLSF